MKEKRKRENDVQELSDSSPITTYDRITFPPSKKRAQVEETDLDMSALRVQIWSVHIIFDIEFMISDSSTILSASRTREC